MNLKPIYIEATTIEDAWFQCISSVLDNGFKYEIQHGSYVGQTRMEFDHVVIYIKKPYAEPYDLMLPQIPSHLNIPNPVANGYVEQYMPYLMTDHIDEKEQYTYGSRINGHKRERNTYSNGTPINSPVTEWVNQVQHFIELLKQTPNTNQAILQVGEPFDCLLADPPCLRHIDMRIKRELNFEYMKEFFYNFIKDYMPERKEVVLPNDVTEEWLYASICNELLKRKPTNQEHHDMTRPYLIFYPYFRSWDLWNGFPANLAGIAVLQKYIADELNINLGPIIASSKGLHIYDYAERLARIRTYRNV